MTPWIVRVLGETSVRLQVLPGRVFRIGRDTEADLCLDDKLVSRRHAEFELLEDGTFEIRDLGSRNGTKVNGRPLRGNLKGNPGDEIRIGGATIVVDGPHQSGTASKRRAPEPQPMALTQPMARTQDGPTERGKGAAVAPAAPAAPEPPRDLPPDIRTSVPGYELTAEVARGRTGIIYRARRLAEHRDVLLKVLDTSWASSENALERFEAEAGALQKIDHPNIVRIGEFAGEESRYFYTLEWVEGETLDRRLKRGRIPPREAIAIGVQVARGLGVAHATGVVHRDIAPASILVTSEGVAKLFDFAFVKTQEDMASFTNIGDVVGDLRYCSPEQAGNPRAVDHRSDFYSLGATIYHAISGRVALEGKNYLDTYQKLVNETPRPLQELVPEVRPKLAACVARCLEKDLEKRFSTAKDLAQALAEALLEAVIAGRKSAPPAGGGIGADFHGVELVELVQVIAGRHATGTITVQADGFEGELRFRQGEIVGARASGDERTREAAGAILDLRAGTFAFRGAQQVSYEPGATPLHAADLALEAIRRRVPAAGSPAPAAGAEVPAPAPAPKDDLWGNPAEEWGRKVS